ncbi:type 1 glutamine amidotransferase family protein [Lachnospiraceae bacterium 46-15]
MRKIILLVVLQQYADWEAAYISSAISMLGQDKYEIKTVSLSKDYVQSIGGFKVLPDYDVASVPDDYGALILIGGMTWRSENTQPVKALVEDCFQKGRVLGGICDASAFLSTAGILNHVVHTSNNLKDLKQWAGTNYTGESNYIAKQAVCNKNVITANGTAPLEYAKEILLALHVADEKTITDWYNFHKLGVYTAPMPEM